MGFDLIKIKSISNKLKLVLTFNKSFLFSGRFSPNIVLAPFDSKRNHDNC